MIVGSSPTHGVMYLLNRSNKSLWVTAVNQNVTSINNGAYWNNVVWYCSYLQISNKGKLSKFIQSYDMMFIMLIAMLEFFFNN